MSRSGGIFYGCLVCFSKVRCHAGANVRNQVKGAERGWRLVHFGYSSRARTWLSGRKNPLAGVVGAILGTSCQDPDGLPLALYALPE
jgi:hypothetical protein